MKDPNNSCFIQRAKWHYAQSPLSVISPPPPFLSLLYGKCSIWVCFFMASCYISGVLSDYFQSWNSILLDP